MSRLSWLIVVFSLAFAGIHAVPILLGKPLPVYSRITIGTAFDLLTPLIMLPIYIGLFRWGHSKTSDAAAVWWWGAVIIFGVLWVEGHSVHLSANAISLVLKGAGVTGDPQTVTHLFDEVLGHYLWHVGMVGLSAVIAAREWTAPALGDNSSILVGIASGVLYGGIFFGAVIEGGTWPLGLTAAVLFAIIALVWGRHRLKTHPLLLFFTTGYLVATTIFIGWAIWWGGFPQFSDVGIIQ